ncbi:MULTISPECIES: hypothetical protein [Streptomyces]|uniref:hypothetical protein n=1 Tax=Streptomyces TaxID=1883 RepID=UPI000B9E53B9|nr:hypothetical protein [Streptomyces kasugaensis]
MVEILREEGFSGPMWTIFIGELQDECSSTVKKWIKNGQIFDKATKAGRPVGLSPTLRACLREDEEAQHDLAWDVLHAASRVFRERALVNGEWSPQRQATLRTFFLNMVAMQFSNAARTWATSERDREHQCLTGEISEWESAERVVDPYKAADARMDLEALCYGATSSVHSMVQLRLLQMKPGEIAEMLGIPKRSAEAIWQRFIKQVRDR